MKHLVQQGFYCYEEVARDVIKEEMDKSEDLPWLNVIGFSKKVMTKTLVNMAKGPQEGYVFFDRGLPDTLAYLRVAGIQERLGLDEIIEKANYYPKVFLTPFWNEIYENDSERKETKEQALKIENALIEVYEEFGFEIVRLNKTSIESRANIILNSLVSCELV